MSKIKKKDYKILKKYSDIVTKENVVLKNKIKKLKCSNDDEGAKTAAALAIVFLLTFVLGFFIAYDGGNTNLERYKRAADHKQILSNIQFNSCIRSAKMIGAIEAQGRTAELPVYCKR